MQMAGSMISARQSIYDKYFKLYTSLRIIAVKVFKPKKCSAGNPKVDGSVVDRVIL